MVLFVTFATIGIFVFIIGWRPNINLFFTKLSSHGCGNLLYLQVFELLREQLWYRPNSGMYIKLIVMLGKCKQPEKAYELFQDMIDEGCAVNHESYTALLSAYSRSGLFDKAFSLLEQMKNTPECRPDVHTYTILIKSCLHVFAFDKVDALLSDMETQGLRPSIVTYNILIDAYGKARKYVATHVSSFKGFNSPSGCCE